MDVHPVEADPPSPGRRQPDQHPCQCGLPGPRGTEDSEHFPRSDGDREVVEQRLFGPPRGVGRGLDGQHALRPRQWHSPRLGRGPAQDLLQPSERGAGVDQLPPAADCLLHRRKRPGEHDRRGDHRPGRELLADHEHGGEAEDPDLQRHPQKTAEGGQRTGAITGQRLSGDGPVAARGPPLGQRRSHTQGLDAVALTAHRLHRRHRLGMGLIGFRQRSAGGQFVDVGDGEQHDGAEQGNNTQYRMDEKHQGDEHRHPRGIEQREHP